MKFFSIVVVFFSTFVFTNCKQKLAKESQAIKLEKIPSGNNRKLGEELHDLACDEEKDYSFEKAKDLVEKGATINIYSNRGTIHCITATCDINAIKYFISHGADVNAKTTYHPRDTPLFYYDVGECSNFSQIAELFLANGAIIDSYQLKEGLVLSDEQKKIIKKYGIINKEETLLMLAEYGDMEDYFEKIENLVRQGVDVNYQSKHSGGTTALMTAAHYCNKKTIELLVRNGAKINVADDNRETVFFYLYGYSHDESSNVCEKEVKNFLIRKGGDINHKNIWGKTSEEEYY
ncbi:MAG: ankyrin repeat domain-containing protein [Spirochaetota bacterium]